MSRFSLFAILVSVVFGCAPASHPGTWTQTQIQDKLKTKYQFTEIQLQPDGDSRFTGTAKSPEGETLKITVSQDKQAKRLKYDFKGDRGWFEDGVYEMD